MKLSLTRLPLMMLLAASTAVACAAPTDGDDGAQGEEDDLTSLTARARTLDFAGYVYVEEGTSDSDDHPRRSASRRSRRSARFAPRTSASTAAS